MTDSEKNTSKEIQHVEIFFSSRFKHIYNTHVIENVDTRTNVNTRVKQMNLYREPNHGKK